MDSKMIIVMLASLFNDQEGDNVYTIQRTGAKEIEHEHRESLYNTPTLKGKKLFIVSLQ